MRAIHEDASHRGRSVKKRSISAVENRWPQNIWVFPKIGVAQNGWFIGGNPIKMDDLGVPLFLETPIFPFLYLTSLNFEMFGRHFCGMLVQQAFDMSEKRMIGRHWQRANGQLNLNCFLACTAFYFSLGNSTFFKGMQICF